MKVMTYVDLNQKCENSEIQSGIRNKGADPSRPGYLTGQILM